VPEGAAAPDERDVFFEALSKIGAKFVPALPDGSDARQDWDFYPMDRIATAEIYSSEGSREAPGECAPESLATNGSVVHALKSGFHFGFVASSDTRDGRPGLSTWGKNSGGLTAVETGAFTRRTVFDTIANGRTYATTGARIILRADLDGHPPGRLTNPQIPPVIHFEVAGTAPIRSVVVVKDGEAAAELAPENESSVFSGSWKDENFTRPANIYLRVTQTDGETAWSSPWFPEHPAYAHIQDFAAVNEGDHVAVSWRSHGGSGTTGFTLLSRLNDDGGADANMYAQVNGAFPEGPVEFRDGPLTGTARAYYLLREDNREGERFIGPVAAWAAKGATP